MNPVTPWDPPPSDFDYADLDPGIRDTVRLLRSHGFETTDSGDGVSKLSPDSKNYGCEPGTQPHVYCSTTCDFVISEARRLAVLLGDEWTVEGVFMASSGTSILSAIKMSQDQMATEFYAREAAR